MTHPDVGWVTNLYSCSLPTRCRDEDYFTISDADRVAHGFTSAAALSNRSFALPHPGGLDLLHRLLLFGHDRLELDQLVQHAFDQRRLVVLLRLDRLLDPGERRRERVVHELRREVDPPLRVARR